MLVGIVARPHGLRGEVAVNLETDFAHERFRPGAELLIERQGRFDAVAVLGSRMHKGRPLVRFAGVADVGEAEPLAGCRLWIREDARPELPEGQYYHSALIGCRVETQAGEPVGEVTAIDPSTGVPLLVIEKPAGARGKRREALVPLAESICRVIDPANRRIVIEPPEGLLDLND
ncbi:MAG TPA: ribosome maturation factor RimM [Vicinamibacterales bacterium]